MRLRLPHIGDTGCLDASPITNEGRHKSWRVGYMGEMDGFFLATLPVFMWPGGHVSAHHQNQLTVSTPHLDRVAATRLLKQSPLTPSRHPHIIDLSHLNPIYPQCQTREQLDEERKYEANQCPICIPADTRQTRLFQ